MNTVPHFYRVMVSLSVMTLIASLTACSSTSPTTSISDPSVDFSKYKTYAFLADLATDKEAYQSLESTYLKRSVSRELERLGLRKVSDNPDLAFNFSIETQEKIRTRAVPTGGYGIGYDPFYDVYYDNWGMNHTTQIDQYTEGKLNIDAIDVQSKKLVWQGSTKGRLTTKSMKNYEATLDTAVREIIELLEAGE